MLPLTNLYRIVQQKIQMNAIEFNGSQPSMGIYMVRRKFTITVEIPKRRRYRCPSQPLLEYVPQKIRVNTPGQWAEEGWWRRDSCEWVLDQICVQEGLIGAGVLRNRKRLDTWVKEHTVRVTQNKTTVLLDRRTTHKPRVLVSGPWRGYIGYPSSHITLCPSIRRYSCTVPSYWRRRRSS